MTTPLGLVHTCVGRLWRRCVGSVHPVAGGVAPAFCRRWRRLRTRPAQPYSELSVFIVLGPESSVKGPVSNSRHTNAPRRDARPGHELTATLSATWG